MTQKEFKNFIKHTIESYKPSMAVIANERRQAELVKEFDPTLSKLLLKHVEAVENAYKYMLARAESKEN